MALGDVSSASMPLADAIITRSYQQEMLDASLVENIIIAQDTGSGKTHVAVLRMKIECDREPNKVINDHVALVRELPLISWYQGLVVHCTDGGAL